MRDRQCALNHDATESLSLSQVCHKQTDHGPSCGYHLYTDDLLWQIFSVHNVEIAHVTLTTPT